MSERKIINNLPDILKSDVEGRNYPVEMIRDVYRYSNYSIKRLSRLYGLKRSEIEVYVKLGEWDRLREEHQQKMYNVLKKDRLELLELKQDIIQRVELYQLLAVQSMLEDLEKHVGEHGDMFVRGGDGEILRDGYGNPILRKIGVSSNDLLTLKGIENIREVNKELLDKANEEESKIKLLKGEGIKVIDVKSFFDKEED